MKKKTKIITKPSEYEIEDQLAEAINSMDSGSKWPGMSYEEGVAAALRWVLGHSENRPMEDED